MGKFNHCEHLAALAASKLNADDADPADRRGYSHDKVSENPLNPRHQRSI